ncbi:transcriptional regulator, TetR family [Oceanobacillus limi]|uniref:Transcriptional regulator, TetR family n=2 Tax=Oceanobacillus limi TaxID=930131 RepID=A0A1H9Z9H6_9BACI|nr:transcriptional regulator, TetR family [Oceanobacillus limi]
MKRGGFRTSLRDKIIHVSLHLFEEHGYHGVTVKQIVETVGTSKGGFYHHFTSKDELLFVIHDTFITYALEKATIANETYTSPTLRLQAIIKSFIKVFDLYKAHISVFYQESNYLKGNYQVSIKCKRKQFKQIILNVIEEGQHTGEFRDNISIEISTMAILGMVNWTYKWYKKTGDKSIDEIGDIFVDIVLRAILSNESVNNNAYQKFIIQ